MVARANDRACVDRARSWPRIPWLLTAVDAPPRSRPQLPFVSHSARLAVVGALNGQHDRGMSSTVLSGSDSRPDNSTFLVFGRRLAAASGEGVGGRRRVGLAAAASQQDAVGRCGVEVGSVPIVSMSAVHRSCRARRGTVYETFGVISVELRRGP